MEINNALQQNIASLQQAIGISVLRKSMHQDAQAMAVVLDGVKSVTAANIEHSVTPHKGGNIDIRI